MLPDNIMVNFNLLYKRAGSTKKKLMQVKSQLHLSLLDIYQYFSVIQRFFADKAQKKAAVWHLCGLTPLQIVRRRCIFKYVIFCSFPAVADLVKWPLSATQTAVRGSNHWIPSALSLQSLNKVCALSLAWNA